MSIDRGLDEEDVVHTYKGVPSASNAPPSVFESLFSSPSDSLGLDSSATYQYVSKVSSVYVKIFINLKIYVASELFYNFIFS